MRRNFCIVTRLILFLLGVALFACHSGSAQDEKKKDPALDLYFSANGLYNRQLYELAVDQYRKFLAKYSTHGKATDARLGLALSLFSSNQRKEAEPEFRKLSTNNRIAKLAPIHNFWGHCLLDQKNFLEAEKAFNWSVQNRPEASVKADALAGLSEALYRQQKWADLGKAATQLRQVSPKSPHVARVSYQGALGLFESKDYDAALVLLNPLASQALKIPLGQHIIYLLAECKRGKKDYTGAVQAYQTAAKGKFTELPSKEGPYREESSYRLGYVYFLQENYSNSAKELAAFRKSFKSSKLVPQATLYLGRSYFEIKDYNNARKELSAIVQDATVGAESTLWLSRSYLAEKNFKGTEQALAGTIARFVKSPLYPDLLFDLGTSQLEQDKFKESAQSFQKVQVADAKGPNVASAHWLQAYSLHRAGEYTASGQVCDQFLAKYKTHENAGSAVFLKAENLFLQDQLAPSILSYTTFLSAYGTHEQAPVATFRLGQAHYQLKDFTKALQSLAPVLGKKHTNPALAQLYFIAGDSAFQLESWDVALRHLVTFIQEQSSAENIDVAFFKHGLAYLKKDDVPNATKTLTQFIQKYPKSIHLAHAHIELGLLHYNGDRHAEAVQLLSKVVANSEHYPHALYYLGYSSLKLKQPDTATTHFNKLITKHPKHELAADAMLQQGKILVGKEQFPQAIVPLQQFLQSHAAHAKADQAAFHLGIAHARQEGWAKAAPNFQKVYQNHPKSTLRDRALYEWAWCEKGQNRLPQAAAHYATFLNQFPQSPLIQDVTFELAELEFQDGKYDQSIQRLTTVLPKIQKPDLKERVLYRLGWNHYNKENLAEAAKNFEAMLTLNPKSERLVMAAYQAGEARLGLKEHTAASVHFKKAVAGGEQGDTLHEQGTIRLGETLGMANKWTDAQRTYQGFLQQYPKSKFVLQASFGIGWAMENQKQYPQAVQAYQKVLDIGGKDETTARCQLQVGECLFAQKKYAEAVPAFLKVRINFNYPNLSSLALLEMGRALEVSGKVDQARSTYEELIRDFPKSKSAVVAKPLLSKLVQN
ncbi:MAG: tetratricopeptide repeat protein [Opitutae bacterium]|nr:tetratricopeptide repeat protein [Opitutae bacterium]